MTRERGRNTAPEDVMEDDGGHEFIYVWTRIPSLVHEGRGMRCGTG